MGNVTYFADAATKAAREDARARVKKSGIFDQDAAKEREADIRSLMDSLALSRDEATVIIDQVDND